MKLVEWSMQGVEAVNCNCAPGCPCQFNQRPTYGNCNAYGFVQIQKGRFGTVDEMASLICWLASEESSFSTGAVFDLSGGRATY